METKINGKQYRHCSRLIWVYNVCQNLFVWICLLQCACFHCTECRWIRNSLKDQNLACNLMSHSMRKPVHAICKQQRRRSACISAQSDQRLCCSLPRQYNISSFYDCNLMILACFYIWTGWFESYLVGKPRRQVFSWRGSHNLKCVHIHLKLNISEKGILQHMSHLMGKPVFGVCEQVRL